MTWPLAAYLGNRIPAGTGSDVWVHVWTLWWLARAVTTGVDPFFTPMLFHPDGVSLTSHNIAWVNFVLWFPLQAALGEHLAYGLTYLLFYSLNAYAMYLFALDTVRDRRAAGLAGLVYGFWPYVLAQSDHPNMLPIAWLPLALLYLRRALAGGAPRHVIAAGGFLALLGIARWQLLVMAGPIIGLYILAQMLSARRVARRQSWTALMGVCGLAILLMAPLLFPVVYAQWTRPFSDELLVHEPEFAADLAAYFLPHQQSLLWSAWSAHLPAGLQFTQQEIYFLGYTSLILAIIGFVANRRAGLLWGTAALVLMLLTLGPTLTVGGREYASVPMPYALVQEWFWARLVRMPHRYALFVGLPVAMLAAYGARELLCRVGKRSMLLFTVLGLLILLESSLGPYPLTTMTIPPWYHSLAAEPEPFAILTLPISPRLTDKRAMYYQTLHGKPLVGGHVSRPPRESTAYMINSPFLSDMLFLRVMDPSLGDVSHQLRYLAQADVRYVVIHKEGATKDQVRDWTDWLTVRPRYEDEYVVVYATAPQPDRDFHVVAHFTPEIGLIRAAYAPGQATQGDLLDIDVRWAALAGPLQDLHVCAQLLHPRAAQAPTLLGSCTPIYGEWPTSNWQAGEVVRSRHLLPLDPRQPPGDYRLALELWDPATSTRVGQPVELGPLSIAPLPRRYDPPVSAHAAQLRFGDVILLHGYDLSLDDLAQRGVLRLTLDWQALQRMETSYKVFVHVVDDASGLMLAQRDAAPRNWTYPTTWWEAGESVRETIELALPMPVTQAVRIYLGLYDESTGERLPIHDAAGREVADRAFVLVLQAPHATKTPPD